MLERINVLKKEIERLRLLAGKCDRDIAQQFIALADEMLVNDSTLDAFRQKVAALLDRLGR